MPDTQIADGAPVQQLLDAALQILREAGSTPLTVARLGQRIVSQTGTPIRQVLGTRPLGPFLERELQGKVLLQGEGAERQIALVAEAALPIHYLYDPAVFSAFSKNLEADHRRFLTPTRPFKFIDVKGDGGPAGSVEIPADYIVEADLPRSQRRTAVETKIAEWCNQNAIDPKTLHYASTGRATALSQNAKTDGLSALRTLISAIPQSERRNYSLPIDLIARLLGL